MQKTYQSFNNDTNIITLLSDHVREKIKRNPIS